MCGRHKEKSCSLSPLEAASLLSSVYHKRRSIILQDWKGMCHLIYLLLFLDINGCLIFLLMAWIWNIKLWLKLKGYCDKLDRIWKRCQLFSTLNNDLMILSTKYDHIILLFISPRLHFFWRSHWHLTKRKNIPNTFQATLSELNRSHEIVKLITASLAKCHALAVSTCGNHQPPPDTLIDGKYTHDHVSDFY